MCKRAPLTRVRAVYLAKKLGVSERAAFEMKSRRRPLFICPEGCPDELRFWAEFYLNVGTGANRKTLIPGVWGGKALVVDGSQTLRTISDELMIDALIQLDARIADSGPRWRNPHKFFDDTTVMAVELGFSGEYFIKCAAGRKKWWFAASMFARGVINLLLNRDGIQCDSERSFDETIRILLEAKARRAPITEANSDWRSQESHDYYLSIGSNIAKMREDIDFEEERLNQEARKNSQST